MNSVVGWEGITLPHVSPAGAHLYEDCQASESSWRRTVHSSRWSLAQSVAENL